MSTGWWRLGLCLACLALTAASCGTSEQPALSLDEAKRITTQIARDESAPPRSIADITAILDQQKPDPVRAASYRKTAEAEPPAGATAAALSHFYLDRSTAAGELGRTNQRLADLRQAAALGREGNVEIDRVMQNLAVAERQVGNSLSALRALEEWQQAIPSNIYGERLANIALFANVYATAGDFDAAAKQLAIAKQMLADAPSTVRKAWPVFAEDWTSIEEAAEATVLSARGRFAEAEKVERDSIVNLDKAIAKYDLLMSNTPSPFSRESMERARDGMVFELTRILVSQGRVIEAEVEIRRELLSLLRRRGRDAPETGLAVSHLAVVLAHEGRFAEAERLARAAVAIHQALGAGAGSWALAFALDLVAQMEVAQGKWTEALATFQTIEQLLGDDAAGQEKFLRSNLARAIAYINLGRPEAAIAALRRVVERTERAFGASNATTAEAHGMLGAALAATGQREAAFAEFNTAIPVLLRIRETAEDSDEGNAARDRRRQVIFEAYLGALADAQGTPLAATLGGDVAALSFPIADAIRGRSVQRALTASSARAAASDPVLADLVRREQDARGEVTALQGELTLALAAPLDQQDQPALAKLRTTIDNLRAARATLRDEIARKFPNYLKLIDPPPATIAETQASLRPGEALIATYVGEHRSFVWAVPAIGAPAFAAVPVDRQAVAAMVTDLRRALEPAATTLGDIPAFDLATAYRLYRDFLLPVETGWRGAKNLLVVPHGPLGQLPFAVLVTEAVTLQPDREGAQLFANYRNVPFLARTAAITQLPSVAALTALRTAPSQAASRKPFVGFGDPWFSPAEAAEATRGATAQPVATALAAGNGALATRGVRLVRRAAPTVETAASATLSQLPRLPDTADEVRSIALALAADPAQDVFTGREANEQRVRTMDLADRKVVMFATHGLVPGDLDGLTQPALALTSPAVAAGAGDGLLTLDKVLGLKLNADWVVLSACNTATGDGAGAEAVSGLGRAFFYAGTRALLVSNWPVETVSARTLTTDLFRRQAQDSGLSRAEALRQAELGLIDGPGVVDPATRRPLYSYAHPLFWAPFSLVGDGG